jgi:hypothetical protein
MYMYTAQTVTPNKKVKHFTNIIIQITAKNKAPTTYKLDFYVLSTSTYHSLPQNIYAMEGLANTAMVAAHT